MNTDTTLILEDHSSSPVIEGLSIALIGPDEERRRSIADVLAKCQGGVIREFSTYPPTLSDVPKLLEQSYDVIIIDLDARPEYALELVENICARGTATVMVYSMKSDSDQLVRCMRAGAREFLTFPFSEGMVNDALVRTAVRRPPARPSAKKAAGKLMAFLGAKGGDGVTTLACNFAVSMAKESGQSTLLIDLDLPLGDAALNLGVVAEYSTINALQNAARLDSAFLSKLLVKHNSGVSVLAAPGKFPQFPATNDAIDRLLAVARQDFDNVVIDMGSRLDLMGTSIFKDGSTVYLVIQTGIAGLRNSNRLISQYFATGIPKLEIVLNRFQSRTLGVAEDQIAKALTRPAQWKIPNDYAAVRRMQHTAIPLALEDSPISRLIRQMARTACGLPAIPEKGLAEKGSGFSLKSLGLSFASKMPSFEDLPPVLKPEGAPVVETASTADPAVPAEVSAKSSADSDTLPAAAVQPVVEVEPLPPAESIEVAEVAGAKAEDSPEAASAVPSSGAETRTYRGATYEKGADGKWYLQKAQAGTVAEEEKQRQTPVIVWPVPAPIAYGVKLSAAQLNAAASVPGKFSYNPAEGEALAVGEHSLAAVFTPEDSKAFTAAEATVALTVLKAASTIAWTAPAPIIYGTPLGGAQLNATASVPGEFVYTPAEGEVLIAGEHTLSVSFTPADSASYEAEAASVLLSVAMANPEIAWAAPAPILYGTALDGAQLNATASVPGKFVYTPAVGELLAAGEQTLSVSFTPNDCLSCETAAATVQISVSKAAPAITWLAPAPIAYGAALGSIQLNAAASVPGEFDYHPAAGELLATGEHTLSVAFTPQDSSNYTNTQAAVLLSVTKATPIILWPSEAEVITEGTALSADLLNATALVEGSFEYKPAAGTVLAAGVHTLSVTFTPAAAGMYNTVQSSLLLTVTEARPEIETAATAQADSSAEIASSPLDPAAPAEMPEEVETANAVEVSVELAAEPVVEAIDVALAESPAEAKVEAETVPMVEAPHDTVFDPVAETAETVLEEVPGEVPVEAEVASAVEAPTEQEVELAAELVMESADSVPEESSVEPEAAADVPPVAEFYSQPVADPVIEPVIETAVAAPVETHVVQEVEAKASTEETATEVSEQALVKVSPKFTFEAGSGLNLMGTAVFPDGTTIYLVMQPGSGGQVDSQRLVSQFLTGGELKPEIVINRYEQRAIGEDEERAGDELGQSANLPSAPLMDAAVRPVQASEKKKGFSLRGLRKSLWAKVSANEKTEEFTRLGLRPEPIAVTPVTFVGTAQVRVNSETVSYAPPFPVEEPRTASNVAPEAARQEEAFDAPETPVETRTYQGSTYVKGADGKWHLQQAANRAVKREAVPAAAPIPQAWNAASEAEPVQAELVPVVPVEAALVEDEALLAAPALAEPPAIERQAAALQIEEQAQVEIEIPLAPKEEAVSLQAEPPAVAGLVEPPRNLEEAASKQVPVQAKKPVKAAALAVRKSQAKAPAKAAAKVKPKTKAAAKAKKTVKTAPNPAAKSKKAAKAPAKAVSKARKAVKANARPPAKAAAKGKKIVKAVVKPAVKGGKPVKSSQKSAAIAKKPLRAGSKATGKAAVRKAVKSPAKPVVKKNSVKAPARKAAKKRY